MNETNKYKCVVCNRIATNEINIFSVMTTGMCSFHAVLLRTKLEEIYDEFSKLEINLPQEEEYLLYKHYAKTKYKIQV